MNGREPSAQEKRDYSTKLYDSFAKTEIELQEELANLKVYYKEVADLSEKRSSIRAVLFPDNFSIANSKDESSSSIRPLSLEKTTNTVETKAEIDYDLDLSSPIASPRSPKVANDVKMQMTTESLREEEAEMLRLREFIDKSNEELREMKTQKGALKASIKRWIDTFEATNGRMPTMEDQKSSLEHNFFEMYQKIGVDIDALRKRQDETYLKIRDSSGNIDRMKELIERMNDS